MIKHVLYLWKPFIALSPVRTDARYTGADGQSPNSEAQIAGVTAGYGALICQQAATHKGKEIRNQ